LAYQRLAVLKHETQAQAGKAKSTRRPWPLKAIVIALVSGLLMGSYARLFEKAREGDVGLGPYSMGVMFALGMFISTFAFNVFFINLPVEGDPVNLQVYLKGKWKHHLLGILGGVIWCTGTVGLLVATSAPESAQVNPLIVAAMWQAVPLVAALWGLLAWKEYKGGDIPVNSLATLMVVLFALGAASIVMSPLYLRKP
jgi:glucose uptake protein